jgi:hypothetical protein
VLLCCKMPSDPSRPLAPSVFDSGCLRVLVIGRACIQRMAYFAEYCTHNEENTNLKNSYLSYIQSKLSACACYFFHFSYWKRSKAKTKINYAWGNIINEKISQQKQNINEFQYVASAATSFRRVPQIHFRVYLTLLHSILMICMVEKLLSQYSK